MREAPLAHSTWDRAMLWLCSQPWFARLLPAGWQTRLERVERAGAGENRLASLVAAQQAGVGVSHTQLAAGADPETMLRWLDEAMADTPRTTPLDMFEVVLARCSAAELQAAVAGAPLGDERILETWVGGRMEWWQAGRERVGRAIPARHAGLALFLVAMGAVYGQASRPL